MSPLIKYDVWHTDYYHGAIFAGDFEMPVIKGTTEIPREVVRFSDSKNQKRNLPNAWVVPYEHDIKLECMWRNAYKYLPGLLNHPGIISWDFSMYRVMPFSLQLWNCFRSRLIGSLYERNGGLCIPNIRPTDSRSYKYAFDGLTPETTVSMGTVQNLRDHEDKLFFRRYVEETVNRLHPSAIIVYGEAPEFIFSPALKKSIEVVVFQTTTKKMYKKKEV